MLGPTIIPFGPSAGRRGAVVVLGGDERHNTGDLVNKLWDINVGNVLFTGGDVVEQMAGMELLTDKLLDRAERHNRVLEIDVETRGSGRISGQLRLNVGRFIVRPNIADASTFDNTWVIMRSERAVLRFECSTLSEVEAVDSWLMALASNPDGELTRSDHRIAGRRRWLDVHTWVHVPDIALLPAILERRWNYSPNLWDVANPEDA